MEAREKRTPAEKMGVSASRPYLIAIQVEPHIKQRAVYAIIILNASLLKAVLSL